MTEDLPTGTGARTSASRIMARLDDGGKDPIPPCLTCRRTTLLGILPATRSEMRRPPGANPGAGAGKEEDVSFEQSPLVLRTDQKGTVRSGRLQAAPGQERLEFRRKFLANWSGMAVQPPGGRAVNQFGRAVARRDGFLSGLTRTTGRPAPGRINRLSALPQPRWDS